METNNFSNGADILEAYQDSTKNLWNQNNVNGAYIISYEFNKGLAPTLKDMLPKVNFISDALSTRKAYTYIIATR